ncbi:MAG: UDP-N-acetylmuramoyl-L-alanyl-D-glutamate--2,6-diaminopimelate ligase [Ruminococcus sp.]|nr:UDP-N-acetylmuramoyl-L-alanyl-D-glutamate--2,6-diaminopimelate ligase [Ruminococcus sp.]
MKLYELLGEQIKTNLSNIEISGVTSDNRSPIKGGELFVCIKGKTFDGHNAAREMIEKGAAAVLVERDLGLPQQIVVSDTRKEYAYLCSRWFGSPEKKLRLIGVTGTNGKTTITTTLKNILTGFGKKVGLIGTCQNEIGDEILHTERTTPEAYELFELFDLMVKKGCEYVVMEVSSQGLEQQRLGPCRFELDAFTNLTQDHLDVHGTMENYYQAKKLLFSMTDTAVINIDDDYGVRYTKEIDCDVKTFSAKEKADFTAANVSLLPSGVKYDFSDGRVTLPVSFNMPGEFNVSNSLCVVACADALGFDLNKTIELLNCQKGVRGRAEVVPTGRDFTVICDYAHTPDAIENILSAMKASAKGRVVCLFGCGGNRDAKKRPLMAKAAQKYADFLIVTSDNPRNEDPKLIIDDILEGIDKDKTEFITIVDRIEAINWAVQNAQKDDIIVLCGKGHEDYQILPNGVKIHLDEREEVAKALLKLKD